MKSKGRKEKDRLTKGRGPVEGERIRTSCGCATGKLECQKASASTVGVVTNAHGQSHTVTDLCRRAVSAASRSQHGQAAKICSGPRSRLISRQPAPRGRPHGLVDRRERSRTPREWPTEDAETPLDGRSRLDTSTQHAGAVPTICGRRRSRRCRRRTGSRDGLELRLLRRRRSGRSTCALLPPASRRPAEQPGRAGGVGRSEEANEIIHRKVHRLLRLACPRTYRHGIERRGSPWWGTNSRRRPVIVPLRMRC